MAKILIVEDMPESAEMMAQILRNYKHDVQIASTGKQGLEFMHSYQPELIICDYWLPDVESREFFATLNANKGEGSTKIVICTASPRAILGTSPENIAFDGFIRKPYRLTELMTTVETLLS